jgi:hypothetical protein
MSVTAKFLVGLSRAVRQCRFSLVKARTNNPDGAT